MCHCAGKGLFRLPFAQTLLFVFFSGFFRLPAHACSRFAHHQPPVSGAMCKQLTCAFLSPNDNFLEQLYAICVRFARDDAILEESVTKKESFPLYLNITRSYPVDDRTEK
jgi:hypothetical protein